jgi:hypothetical protein
MSLHTLLYEWDIERVIMCMSDWDKSALYFEDVISEGAKRSLRREVLSRMHAACLGTTRELGSGGRCTLRPSFHLWKYPMAINNPICPQPPLRKGIYQFLREIGIIHGKGGNLNEEFGLAIQHTTELFGERYTLLLRDWLKKLESAEGHGPFKPRNAQPPEYMDDYGDDDDDKEDDRVDAMVDGRTLVDLPGGEDRRGVVSKTTRSQWKDAYSSRRQRALDLSDWEGMPEEDEFIIQEEVNAEPRLDPVIITDATVQELLMTDEPVEGGSGEVRAEENGNEERVEETAEGLRMDVSV